jgi:hypothetical protein
MSFYFIRRESQLKIQENSRKINFFQKKSKSDKRLLMSFSRFHKKSTLSNLIFQ